MPALADLTGVWVRRGSGIGKLRGLLQSWTRASLDYCRCHDWEDNGWWYTERASLSILAGAAWRLSGWCALEEYSTDKRRNPGPNESDPTDRRGRADLWVGNTVGYAIEAKQSWQSIGPAASGCNPKIVAKLNDAWKDAGTLKKDAADQRLAALFVAVHIPVNQVKTSSRIDKERVRIAVEAWLRGLDLKSNDDIHGYAWVFPSKVDKFISKNGKTLYPGTLLILRERKRCSSGRAARK